MMTLEDAARFFDTNLFIDTYGSATFSGQLLPFSDSTRSGSSTKRRILEVGGDIAIPEKRTVTSISGTHYIVAEMAEDLFDGGVIRAKYPVVPADTQYNIRDIGQTLADSGGQEDAYVAPSYIRRVIFEDQSDYYEGYELFFSSYFSAGAGDIISDGTSYYRCRAESRTDEVGFRVVEAVQLESPLQTLDFTGSSAFDPVTDEYTPVNIDDVSCFVEHIQLDFIHEALGYKDLEAGDKAISFLKSQVTNCKVGDKIGGYEILSLDDSATYWLAHARKR